jgi:hypothetical protein
VEEEEEEEEEEEKEEEEDEDGTDWDSAKSDNEPTLYFGIYWWVLISKSAN